MRGEKDFLVMKQIADALRGTLISPNECDRNLEGSYPLLPYARSPIQLKLTLSLYNREMGRLRRDRRRAVHLFECQLGDYHHCRSRSLMAPDEAPLNSKADLKSCRRMPSELCRFGRH